MSAENRSAKVVVVTGAGSGMGRACIDHVRAFADVLIAADLRAPEIDGCCGVACDVSDRVAVSELVASVTGHGSLRALIHAAGVSPTMADPLRILEVNLVGTHLLLDAFEELVTQGAVAVCFASSAAHQFAPFITPEQSTLLEGPFDAAFLDRAASLVTDSGIAYGLSKAGVVRAVRRAAVSWGSRGGRVVSVSPGIIGTPMGLQEFEHQQVMRRMVERSPLARMGLADEVAAVVGFLSSDAASFVTGIDVLVDGGLVHASV